MTFGFTIAETRKLKAESIKNGLEKKKLVIKIKLNYEINNV